MAGKAKSTAAPPPEVLTQVPEWASTTAIAQLIGRSTRRVQQLTQDGVLSTEVPPGGGARRYRTARTIQDYMAWQEQKIRDELSGTTLEELTIKKLQAEVELGRPWSAKLTPPEGFQGLYRKDFDLKPGQCYFRYDANVPESLYHTEEDDYQEIAGKQETLVKKDRKDTTEGSYQEVVTQNSTTKIGGDRTQTVQGSRTSTVQGNDGVTVQGSQTTAIQGDATITVSGKLTLQVGGCTVQIDGSSVSVTAASVVRLNAPTLSLEGTTAANVTPTAGGADVEADDDFKERIYLAPGAYSTAGPEDAYRYHAMSYSAAVGDVEAESYQAAGTVDLVFVLTDGSDPGPELIEGMKEYLSARLRRPMTDLVHVSAPQKVAYTIEVTYWINRSQAAQAVAIQQAVNQAVEDYKTWQRTIGRDINPSKLHELMMKAGAKRLEIAAPVYTAVSKIKIAALEGDAVVRYGGLEDD